MISKALIPIAGRGTRMGPICAAIPKAMLPLVNVRTQRVIPVLHHILAAARQAGVHEAGLVVSPWQQKIVRRYLEAVADIDRDALPDRLTFIVQDRPLGFGDAVLRGREFVGKDPAMVLLGDHVYEHEGGPACAAQVARAFVDTPGVAMVGVQAIGVDEIEKVGVVRGELLRDNVYHCGEFAEKPDSATARQSLVTEGLDRDTFLAHCGIYIFTTKVFDCLSELACGERYEEAEVELSDAQSMLIQRYPDAYWLCRIEGVAHDIGSPGGYARALDRFRTREGPKGTLI